MKASILAAVVLLVAASAAAEDFYLPLSPRTELELTNPTAARAIVTVERLGTGQARELPVEPGQTLRFDDDGETMGVLHVRAGAAIRVQAVSRCVPCGSRISLPVLDAQSAVRDGEVPVRQTPSWRSGMLVVNPQDEPALVTLTVHRGAEVVDQSLLRVPARGMRRVDFDRAPDESFSFVSAQPLLLFGYERNEQTGGRVFTPVTHATTRKRRSVRSGSPQQVAQTIVLTPSKDNTLFESPSGDASNGVGVHLFAGATRRFGLRRALLAFDVASQIPAGSRITRATLRLQVSQSISGSQPMTLHRVAADWGEGASNAGQSSDGGGATSHPGDATWAHRFFPNQPWTTLGGDFNAAADATAVVDFSGTWESSELMIARVQGWLDQPATNFGWVIRGIENAGTTAKRFDSREIAAPERRPTLTIEFVR
ncbi:MAG TPA: DNRLRE domain-containing protein [Thermoanaerobaculia bacterium]|jgi:hypothetical protein